MGGKAVRISFKVLPSDRDRASALCIFRETIYLLYMVLLSGLLGNVAYADTDNSPESERPGALPPQHEVRQPPEASAPGGGLVDIPAVIDRPFDIEEGPYVTVRAFRLIDAEDMPEFDIDLSEIQTDILDNLLAQQPARGFSIGQLQDIANEVTRFYRAKGLILSQAVIPVQTIVDGVVNIRIFIGRLGRVLAEGNDDFSIELLRKPFANLEGKPVTKETAEAALLTLTDFPGLSVFGVFQPGQVIGEADMLLQVQEEKDYDVAYRVDNHGLPETGRDRFRTTIDWNNPTGGADRLTATIQQTYSPKNSFFWSADYLRFLGRGFTAGITGFRNTFDVGGELEASQIAGESSNFGLFLEKSFIRSRRQNLLANLAFDRKISRSTTVGLDTNRDDLSIIALSAEYDSVDTYHPLRLLYSKLFKIGENVGGGLNFAALTIHQGLNGTFGSMGSAESALRQGAGRRPSRQGGDEFAAGKFTKLSGSFSRLQLLTNNQSLLLRGELQYSPDVLVPLEQYSVGGPGNVRAFPDAQHLFDKAYFLSAEYILNAPFIADKPAFANRTWGELLQISAFYDFAAGKNNDPTGAPQDVTQQGSSVNIRGYGLGLRFNLPGVIESRLVWARQLGDNTNTPSANGHRAQVWGEFTYSF